MSSYLILVVVLLLVISATLNTNLTHGGDMAIIILAVLSMIIFIGIFLLVQSMMQEHEEYNIIANTLNKSGTGLPIVNKRSD